MTWVPDSISDPENPESVQAWVEEAARAINGGLNDGDVINQDSNQPNGTVENTEGSWVRVTFTAAALTQTCTHNLGANMEPTPTTPNVYWSERGKRRGAADVGIPFHLEYISGGSITANSIDLTLVVSATDGPITQNVTYLLRFRKSRPW